MHCLVNMCYVCLEKKSELIRDINSSLSVYKDIIHIIDYLPINLAWLKTKRTILICEECCLHLRETYQFLEKCLKNSALMQGYMDLVNCTSLSYTASEAELVVNLNRKVNTNINEAKVDIKLEEEIYPFQWEQNIEETEDIFVNIEDSFTEENSTWKREQVDDDNAKYLIGNISSIDKESDSKLSENSNAYFTNTDFTNTEFTNKQVHATNMDEQNTAVKNSYKCSTCNKCFMTKHKLNVHTRIHTSEKPNKCSTCKKCFTKKSLLIRHVRIHTGEKPYECSTCKKCFTQQSNLVRHIQRHTGEKPYECAMCRKCFVRKSDLVRHIRVHTGEKPYECATCKKCFTRNSSHMRTHTSEKPFHCIKCKNSFRFKSSLVRHMRTHTGE